MQQTSNGIDKKRIVIAGGLATVALVAIVFFIDQKNAAQNGVIEITGAPQGTLVLLDNKRRARFEQVDDVVTLENLAIGTHTLVLAKDGHWPWTKDVVLANRETISLSAFLLPQEPLIEVVHPEDERYADLLSDIQSTQLPTEDSALTSSDGTTSLWVDNNTIMASWDADETPSAAFCILGDCHTTLMVLPADRTIEDAAFLHERNDIIVFAAKNGIFALEIDKRGTQNFQPIYLGTSPEFTFTEDGLLALVDEERLLLVHLF